MQQIPSPLLSDYILASCKSIHNLPASIAQLIITGQLHHPSTLRRLTNLISLSPNHPSAIPISRLLSHHYFHLTSFSTTFLHNLLIRAFSRSQRPDESISAFISMLRCPSSPDHFTFPFLATANSARRSSAEGSQTHSQVVRRGFHSDVYVLNSLISMYSAFGDMGSAQNLFSCTPESLDVVSWNTIINGYVKAGLVDVARNLFDEMPVRDEVSWGAIISGYAGRGDIHVAQALFDRMPVRRNFVTYNSMISGFVRQGLLPLARKMFDEMPSRTVVSWNSMVSGYVMNGEMGMARELFDRMPEKDVISWSCMIAGYAQCSRDKEALQLFNEMRTEGQVRPNEITMVGVLSACAHLAALDLGMWVHAYIDRNQLILDDDRNLGAALIDMYSKSGSLETAIEVFRKLERRNVSSWNALITGLAVNGAARESVDAFEHMQISGVKPNDITFLGVLTACTHGGLVEEGRHYFESMSKVHGVQPEMKHYGCMIDMLGRAGLLEEAEGIVRSMPMKPDVMVLGALLGACRIHRNVMVADRVRRDFLELNSKQAGCHVLLSNIYAAAAWWADASEMRSFLKKKGIRKDPGSSSVEIGPCWL